MGRWAWPGMLLAAAMACSSDPAAPPVALGGACDDDAQCPPGSVCADDLCASLCQGPLDCPSSVGCRDGVCRSCNDDNQCPNPYRCDTPGGRCNAACGGDGECVFGGFCEAASGTCEISFASGIPCARDRECLSSTCADGVCCATACDMLCESCAAAHTGGADGACGFVANGADPTDECFDVATCDGAGACQGLKLDGTACAAANECDSGFCRDGFCCETACNGACESCTGIDTAMTDGVCAVIPLGDDPADECPGATACDGARACFDEMLGDPCTMGLQCTSGECVEMVCCNDPCVGECMTCLGVNTADTDGVCGPALPGTDPDTECAGLGCSGDAAFGCRVALGSSCTLNAHCAQGGCIGGTCAEIRSLTFGAGELSRVMTAGERRTFTFAAWIKLGDVFNGSVLWAGQSGTIYSALRLTNGKVAYDDRPNYRVRTLRRIRDGASWIHVVVTVDTTAATDTDRVRIYINGSEGPYDIATYPAQNFTGFINAGREHRIGGDGSPDLDALLTEIHFVDGAALPPTAFGIFDADGNWQPAAFTGAYGPNGYHLPFADDTSAVTLGTDAGPSGNDWTLSGLDRTDVTLDHPLLSFGRLNALDADDIDVSYGNLRAATSVAGRQAVYGTFAVSSGRWYWELYPEPGAGVMQMGLANSPARHSGTFGALSSQWLYDSAGQVVHGGVGSAFGSGYAAGDVVSMALDLDTGRAWVGINGAWQGSGDPTTGANPTFAGITGAVMAAVADTTTGDSPVARVSFGQQAFSFAPPAGFGPWTKDRLAPQPVNGARSNFDVITWAGDDAATRAMTGLSFRPDLVWIKQITGSQPHALFDSTRGPGVRVVPSNNNAEVGTEGVVSFDVSGFTIDGTGLVNASGHDYVGWCWRDAPAAGLDVVTYTGDGAAGRTIPHDLAVPPAMIAVKRRNANAPWMVYHFGLGGTQRLMWNSTAAAVANNTVWNDTAPDASTVTLGIAPEVNGMGDQYVAYIFAAVPGQSQFGRYVGQSSNDGPFITTSFEPRFVMLKRWNNSGSWFVYDRARQAHNPMSRRLRVDTSAAEAAAGQVEFHSNGVKLSSTQIDINGSGQYLYMVYGGRSFAAARGR